MRSGIIYATFLVGASAHGMIRSIEGANGVTMPGLSGMNLLFSLTI